MTQPDPADEFLSRAADTFLLAPFRDALIRFDGLPTGLQVLAVLGYVLVVLLLMLALALELLAPALPAAAWDVAGRTYQMPYLALLISLFGMAMGWAYLLVAATEGGRLLFCLLVLFWGLVWFWVSPWSLAPVLFACLIFPVGLGCGIAYLFTYRKPFWRAMPLLRFLLAAGTLVLLLGMYWLLSVDDAQRVAGIRTAFIFLSWAATIFWIASGPALVDLLVRVVRWAMASLRRILPDERLRAPAMVIFLVHPWPALLAYLLARRGSTLRQFAFGDGIVAMAILVWGLALLLARRWDTRNALTVLGMSLLAPAFGLALALAMRGKDISTPLAYAVESVGFVPPLLLFIVVMVYNVFGLMSGFANSEGRFIPRRARIPLCFGAALLIIAFAIFFINVRTAATGKLDQSFQGWMDNLFLLSIFFLGLPYLAWIAWKRRERLVGVSAGETDGSSPGSGSAHLTGTTSAATPRDPR